MLDDIFFFAVTDLIYLIQPQTPATTVLCLIHWLVIDHSWKGLVNLHRESCDLCNAGEKTETNGSVILSVIHHDGMSCAYQPANCFVN